MTLNTELKTLTLTTRTAALLIHRCGFRKVSDLLTADTNPNYKRFAGRKAKAEIEKILKNISKGT